MKLDYIMPPKVMEGMIDLCDKTGKYKYKVDKCHYYKRSEKLVIHFSDQEQLEMKPVRIRDIRNQGYGISCPIFFI